MRTFNSKKKKLISLLLTAVILLATVFVAGAEQADTPNFAALDKGATTATLGISGAEIATADDLKKLSDDVNSGTDTTGLSYILTADINLASLAEWSPIGTQTNPFRGTFVGNSHVISGLGTDTHTSLFGYLNGATLKGVMIRILMLPSLDDAEPSDTKGLYISAEDSTIENCRVLLGGSNRNILFANINPEVTWYTDNPALASYNITSAAELLGMAEILLNGGANNTGGVAVPVTTGFAGQTFNITGTIDMAPIGSSWPGIGTETNPFKGTLTGGGTIKNLISIQSGVTGVGFVAYANDATFDNLKIIDGTINGAESVGLLVGYMEDSTVVDCMSSGSVSGSHNVGGLVGQAAGIVPGNESTIKWSYSTANVGGVLAVGGLVGRLHGDTSDTVISNCFTTGDVSGTLMIGGLCGLISSPNGIADLVAPLIRESATSGVVRGIGKTGGVLGAGSIEAAPWTTFDDQFLYCYTTSTVYAFSDSGLIAGAQTTGDYNYASGYIVAPETDVAGMGGGFLSGTGGYVANMGRNTPAYTNPNTVYARDNYLNQDQTHPEYAYEKVSHLDSVPQEFFNAHPNVDIYPPVYTQAALVFADDGNGHYYPESGRYPKFHSFEGATNQLASAFKAFSTITTEVDQKSMPDKLFYKDGNAVDLNENVVKVPNIAGAVWNINAKINALNIVDPTLDGGANVISVDTNKDILLTDAFVKEQEVTFSASVPAIPGFELKYTVTIEDQANRPTRDSISTGFYESIVDAKAGTDLVSPSDYLHYLEFTEPVKAAPAATAFVKLVEYTDDQFSAVAATHATTVSVSVSNDTTLKIMIPQNFLKSGVGYSIDFDTPDTVIDAKNILFKQPYFFRTPKNLPPELTFDTAYPLADPTENGSTGKQIVNMQEDDMRYFGLYDGIDAKDEMFVAPTEAQIINPEKLHAVVGDGYPVLNMTPSSTNFYRIPGQYKFEYRLNDPLYPGDPSMASAVITRIYRVNGLVKVKQGGGNLKEMHVILTFDDVIRLKEEMAKQGIDFATAVNQELVARYITATGSDQLTAYSYNYLAQNIGKKITFNTGVIKDDTANTGLETIMSFSVEDGDTYNFSISIAADVIDKDIVLDNYSYVVENSYTKSGARKFFGAKVVYMSNGQPIPTETIQYDFSKVNPRNYGVPQEVIMTVRGDKDTDPVTGLPELRAAATITIVKANKWEHPEQKWTDLDAERENYWNGKMDIMRTSKAGRNLKLSDATPYNLTSTPADVLLVIANQKDMDVEITLKNNYIIALSSDKITSDLVNSNNRLIYNFNVEDMFSLAVERDAKGAKVQQFHTLDQFKVPGELDLTLTLNKDMPQKDLALYSINAETGKYQLEQKISSESVKNNKLTLTMTTFKGEYVITDANLDGISSSLER